MIDRIEGTSSYGYKQVAGKGSVAKSYEAVQKQSDKKKTGTAKKETSGVVLDLSGKDKIGTATGSGLQDQTVKRADGLPARQEKSFFQRVRDFFAAIGKWLIDFWESDAGTAREADQSAVGEKDQEVAEDQSGEALKGLAISQQSPDQAISDQDLMIYTLLAELSVEHMTLDDLDADQVSQLMEAGVDIEAISQGTYDYNAVLNQWSSVMGFSKAEEEPLEKEEAQPAEQPAGVYSPLAREAAQAGSLSRLEELITENGTKKLAHNSDLLTFYDKKGQLVHLDDTQKHRVLYGDKNILKL